MHHFSLVVGIETVMKRRGDFKSQIISAQKPRKRRSKSDRRGSVRGKSTQNRYKVDLIELHRNIIGVEKQRKLDRYRWVKGLLFALIAVLGFFLLGYLIGALPVSMWAKTLLFTLVAALGIASSYLVAASFR